MEDIVERKFSQWHCIVTIKYGVDRRGGNFKILSVDSEIPDDIVVMRRIVDHCMNRIRQLKGPST